MDIKISLNELLYLYSNSNKHIQRSVIKDMRNTLKIYLPEYLNQPFDILEKKELSTLINIKDQQTNKKSILKLSVYLKILFEFANKKFN